MTGLMRRVAVSDDDRARILQLFGTGETIRGISRELSIPYSKVRETVGALSDTREMYLVRRGLIP